MKKSQYKKRKTRKSKTIRKRRGGDCGCNKLKPIPDAQSYMGFGGYGQAGYQGGLPNGTVIPINDSIGSAADLTDKSNIHQGRFSPLLGGKKKRNKKTKGGMNITNDWLLGSSTTDNLFTGFGTTTGSNAAATRMMTGL